MEYGEDVALGWSVLGSHGKGESRELARSNLSYRMGPLCREGHRGRGTKQGDQAGG